MPGDKKFSVYLNDEYQCDVQAKNHAEAAQKFAAEKGLEGQWSMGSSRFAATNGDFITAKMSFK